MTSGTPRNLRVAPLILPEQYVPPPAPDASASPALRDTYKQTRFLLGDDLRLFARGLESQRQVLEASSASRFRTIQLAALALFWSRTYSALRDASLLLMHGSYPSIPHIVRSAAECIAVQGQLHDAEMAEFESWLDNSLLQEHQHQAVDLNLGRYRAASRLAEDDLLGAVYRIASDLSMTPFGGSLFLTASESNPQRVQVAFGDQAFHAGFAEMMSGWLLRLCERQLACLVAAPDVFNVSLGSRAEAERIAAQTDEALARPTRCRAEDVDVNGERRYLVLNFRRSAAGATRKLLL
jgi:hypothetical protein